MPSERRQSGIRRPPEARIPSASSPAISNLPGLVLSLLLFLLAVLAWPGFLEKIFSLEWRVGNVRPVAYAVQVLLGLLFIGSLLSQRRLNASVAKRFPSRRYLAFSLVALLLGFVAVVAALEIVFRLLHFPLLEIRIPSENAMAQYDEELGWAYIPHHSSIQEFGSEQRRVAMYFDGFGSRVPSPETRRDPDAATVLFLGCSYAFGHGLPYEETVQGRLEAMPGFPFQIVNLGVQGYGTDQSLLMLKRRFKEFNTKAVVYICMSDHRLRNANYDRRIFAPRARVIATKPLFVLNQDGTLTQVKKPCRTEDLSYSRVWACVRIVLDRWGPLPSLDLTRALVAEMKSYVESNGATFLVVFWDEIPYLGLKLNMINTNLNPPPDWDSWRIQGDVHPDARAHFRVAALILEKFRELGLLLGGLPSN